LPDVPAVLSGERVACGVCALTVNAGSPSRTLVGGRSPPLLVIGLLRLELIGLSVWRGSRQTTCRRGRNCQAVPGIGPRGARQRWIVPVLLAEGTRAPLLSTVEAAVAETGWKRRRGVIWDDPANARASAGTGGSRGGCTSPGISVGQQPIQRLVSSPPRYTKSFQLIRSN